MLHAQGTGRITTRQARWFIGSPPLQSLTTTPDTRKRQAGVRAFDPRGALGPLAVGTALLFLGPIPATRAGAQAVSPPPFTVLQNSGSLADGFIFVGPQAISAQHPVQGPEIVDNKGRIVWFLPTPGAVAMDFRVQTYQGNPVVTWSQGITFGDSTASGDSALLITLPPGAYTAEVSGSSGDTGVALVEVFE